MDEQSKDCGCEQHCHCSDAEWHSGEALTTCIECLVAELHSCPVSIEQQVSARH